MAVIRDWTSVRPKVREGCRICGQPAEGAHIIGRIHDKPTGPNRKKLWVNPVHICPLCREHHTAYDVNGLDLLPYLNLHEQAEAVRLVGTVRAYRRMTGGGDIEQASEGTDQAGDGAPGGF